MSYAALLVHVPMFSSLGPEDLEQLSAVLQPWRYSKGEVIFHQGDVATALYIVRKGEVSIRLSTSEGKERLLTLLKRGDSFGEMALLDGEPRSTDAVAREETSVLRLQREDFQRFVETRPWVAMRMLAEMSRVIRRITRRVYDASFLDARSRLARVLLDMVEEQGGAAAQEAVLASQLTQSDLAHLCGLTRESTNKCLRAMARDGILSYEDGRITVLKVTELRANAD
ncbi:Crp/Fnr family transcriptional regulator [Archangium primigenium]|uniref:Crp/Fnr family transcriptional regulator n=1 Tax=[Archangium] primigenium TaxID=2792470 RepID=UPI0019594E56|nr:Crp/Fnr family transcriptional regulator [Archangium primigenium]MBM7114454.1 Crp/Fnr family transcriptional regulator [Archangium primigenium]